jgi:hypothetical protein
MLAALGGLGSTCPPLNFAVRVRHEVVPVAVMTAIAVASRRYGRT